MMSELVSPVIQRIVDTLTEGLAPNETANTRKTYQDRNREFQVFHSWERYNQAVTVLFEPRDENRRWLRYFLVVRPTIRGSLVSIDFNGTLSKDAQNVLAKVLRVAEGTSE
jgi:hypothetical protein